MSLTQESRWTLDDLSAYKSRENSCLDQLYQPRIPSPHPDQRMAYLLENVLQIDRIDYKFVQTTSKTRGLAAVLNLLEDFIATEH